MFGGSGGNAELDSFINVHETLTTNESIHAELDSFISVYETLTTKLSGFLFVSSQKFVRNSIAASGTVTGLARQTNTNHGTTSYTYSPEVSFTDKNGNEHSFVSNTSSNPPAYRAGSDHHPE